MAANVPIVAARAGPLIRQFIQFVVLALSAKEAIDIATGATAGQEVQGVNVDTASMRERRYWIVDLQTNTLIMHVSRRKLFRLLSAPRRPRCRRVTQVVHPVQVHDAHGAHVVHP